MGFEATKAVSLNFKKGTVQLVPKHFNPGGTYATKIDTTWQMHAS